eukprot:NODE_20_length_44879_cov_0.624654.p24 type:complete len:237 gc:universal NODE_20_length_44879_cov_0.624654:6533-5823(-)
MDIAKKASCKAAIQEIRAAKLIGIGSGSTIVHLFELMRETFSQKELSEKTFVPTSFQSQSLIQENDLNLGTLNQFPLLDVVIDGADEVCLEKFTCIKGGGGCHFLEKLVYQNSKCRIIVADESKPSSILGSKFGFVPVEVSNIALSSLTRSLKEMKFNPKLRMSNDKFKAGPIITDMGNSILDIHLEHPIENELEMYKKIKLLPGVIEVGLFWDMNKVIIGKSDGQASVYLNKAIH